MDNEVLSTETTQDNSTSDVDTEALVNELLDEPNDEGVETEEAPTEEAPEAKEEESNVLSTLVYHKDNPCPQQSPAKDATTPIIGLRLPYLKIKALKGIKEIEVSYEKDGKTRTFKAWGYNTEATAKKHMKELPEVFTVAQLNGEV